MVTMNKELLVTVIILGVVWGEAETCFSCGSECQSACGTRHFRTCCFNYLKKRSSPEPLSASLDPSLRLELWLAKSRHPYFQQRIVENDAYDMENIPKGRNENNNEEELLK
ncbi:trissin [Dendroctonus ponderosae]|nr:trissin [Dendroctonus ponderosae]